MLQWAQEQDPPCPWDPQVCLELAAENDHDFVFAYVTGFLNALMMEIDDGE